MSDISMNATLAAKNAYAPNKTGFENLVTPEKVKHNDESGFALLLNQLRDTEQSTLNAEVKSLEAIAGKADIVDVVNAITNAEMAIGTLVTTRDKVIGAYKEIMNMPI